MIKTAVENWEKNKGLIEKFFLEKHPDNYRDIVYNVISNITEEEYEDFSPDPERIHQIDDGNYQGTLVFVISAKGYTPSNYWYCMVDYGSCSGCDTLEGIRNYDEGKPSEEQIREYMLLSLHIVQGLKKMGQPDE